jgi:hypothetical protein
MSRKIDEKFLPKVLRESADTLDEDFWGNIEYVIDRLVRELKSHRQKMGDILRDIFIQQLREYGKKIHAEDVAERMLDDDETDQSIYDI